MPALDEIFRLEHEISELESLIVDCHTRLQSLQSALDVKGAQARRFAKAIEGLELTLLELRKRPEVDLTRYREVTMEIDGAKEQLNVIWGDYNQLAASKATDTELLTKAEDKLSTRKTALAEYGTLYYYPVKDASRQE